MVSLEVVVMRIQPDGVMQEICTKSVLVAKAVSVAEGRGVMLGVVVGDADITAEPVKVAVGKSREIVGGMGVGDACGGRVSAKASEMPPITNNMEMRAMRTPPPNCRKDCIIYPSTSGREAGAR
jgi:hypothetical protein